ncbi:MAG: helix-turn-helix domain-containing protein [Candidatus Micrarchaeota archaeon]
MWVAKLKFWHANSYVTEKTRQVQAVFTSYYLNTYQEGDVTYITRVGLVFGRDWEKLMKTIVADPRVEVLKAQGRQVIFKMPANRAYHTILLDGSVFQLRPPIAKGGYEFWEVAAMDKKRIHHVVQRMNKDKKVAWAEVLSLKEKDLDLFVPSAFSKLTEKQRWAYEMACKYGYYSYPRENDLETVAKKMKVPFSTFREHLRIAESKLLPALWKFLTPDVDEME